MRHALLALAAACAPTAEPELVEVTRGDLVLSVVATGELASADSTDITPPQIQSVYTFKIAWLAPEGSVVGVGEPIVTFDGAELERTIQSSQTESLATKKRLDKRRQEIVLQHANDDVRLLEADAGARKAKLKLQTPRELLSAIDAHEQALDDEEAQIALAETQRGIAYQHHADAVDVEGTADYLGSTTTRVEQLQRDLAAMTVTSPRAGVVAYVGEGDIKKAVGSEAWANSPCVQVVGLAMMSGNAEVDEVDLPRVALHQPATLRLDALPDLAIHGSVQAIATAMLPHSYDDPSNVARVGFAIDTHDPSLRPGMRFRADIETARIADVVQVPATAVIVTADGAVAERADGERVPVVLGRRSHDVIEIVSGLTAGDRVVVQGAP